MLPASRPPGSKAAPLSLQELCSTSHSVFSLPSPGPVLLQGTRHAIASPRKKNQNPSQCRCRSLCPSTARHELPSVALFTLLSTTNKSQQWHRAYLRLHIYRQPSTTKWNLDPSELLVLLQCFTLSVTTGPCSPLFPCFSDTRLSQTPYHSSFSFHPFWCLGMPQYSFQKFPSLYAIFPPDKLLQRF